MLIGAESTDVCNGVDANGKRLDLRAVSALTSTFRGKVANHGAVLERAVIGELVAQVSGNAVVSAEGTVVRGRSGENDVRAQLREPLGTRAYKTWLCAHLVATPLAVLADTARCAWLHCDAVADLEVLHFLTN